MVAAYRRQRDVLVAGLRCQLPRGAFYAFPNVSAFGKSSDWIADYLLDEAGVALLSGTGFGSGGEGYLRLCFANSMENIEKALARIAAALAGLR